MNTWLIFIKTTVKQTKQYNFKFFYEHKKEFKSFVS